MKTTDKFVLVLVASLALLLAGCGGGSSSTAPPPDPGPTPAETAIMNAEAELTAAQDALAMLGASATDAAMEAAYRAVQQAADNLVMALKANGGSPVDVEAATTARQNAMNMADSLAQKIADDAMAANVAMKALAGKLHANIDDLTNAVISGAATYDGGDFRIQRSSSGLGSTPVVLSEDKTEMVAANRGWEGMKVTAAPNGDGTYEAVVYSNVGAPTQGKKFGSAAAVTDDGAYQYQLDAASNTAHTIDTSTAGVSARIALPGVTRTAGTETFNLPDPNTGGATNILVSGSYHGVSGTYSCTPATPANGCTAAVAAKGFTLGGADSSGWSFNPDDPNDRVTDTPDTDYASYGWWIFESEDGNTFHASAFAIVRGTVPAAAGVTALLGTATYSGGAAGKYALISSTGGTNDAGHFTADATLEADFNTNMVAGTIDNFMGADGMPRDWSVELKENLVGNAGHIDSFGDGNGFGEDTVWTIGGTAAGAAAIEAGDWTGTLRNNGDDGVPQVATGIFYTVYDRVGKMVGAFGATKDE